MPYIGIFWFHGNDIIAKKCNLKDGTQTIAGLIDSPFDHWLVWDEISKPKELWGLEYQQLPRGRVLYDIHNKKANIYLDKNLCSADHKQKIRIFFELQSVAIKWSLDSHYRTLNIN